MANEAKRDTKSLAAVRKEIRPLDISLPVGNSRLSNVTVF